MNAATLARDPFAPRPPRGRGPALGLAFAAHVVLLLALAFGVNWRASQPPTLAAELWSAVPQAAAPRAVEPPPPPPAPPTEPKRPEPVVKAAPPVAPPKPEREAQPDPQIAIEKARREEAKRTRAEQEEKQEAKREKAERERAEKEKVRLKEEAAQKKALAEKQKLEKQRIELAKAEQAEQADAARESALRDKNLKRLQGLAGATGGPADTGTALRSSGPSESYAGRIVARIKPNIVFTEAADGNPVATVEVKLAPDGTIIGKRLLKSSGSKAWDDAVLRAIDRTEVLPRDTDGRVPGPFPISFRMRD